MFRNLKKMVKNEIVLLDPYSNALCPPPSPVKGNNCGATLPPTYSLLFCVNDENKLFSH